MKIQPTIFWIALASLALGLFLLPAGASAAPLVYIQLLARQDGTTNPFTSTITPTAVGEEFDWIVVATLAPAGTQNTNLPVDANGKQQIGSWQLGDGFGGTYFSLFENPSAPTQVSFQNPGFLGATNTGAHAGIDPSISNGLTTSLTNSGNFGNASYSGGVNTIAYQYTGEAPGTTQTLTPTGISQAPGGNALWQNFAAGTGTSGGVIAARANGSSSNDLVYATAIAGANYYTGVDDGTVNTSGTNQSPVTMILESGSHDYYNTATGNGAKVDSTFVVTALGGGSSILSVNTFDMNPGNPGGADTGTDGFLNLQYHDTAGTLQKPGPGGSLQYSSQTSSDPVIQYTGLAINLGANDASLAFSPTTASFGRVLLNSTPTLNANLNNGSSSFRTSFSAAFSNGITGPATGTAVEGSNSLPIQLQNNAAGSGTAGNNSWTYTVTDTGNTADTSAAGKTLTVTADVAAPRTFNSVSVSGGIGSAGGAISIPFTITSTGDFVTTTSVTVNPGGGTLTSNGFSTSGSYTFNGGQANIGNVTFNAAADTYTASGTITGTLASGQIVTGSIMLPVTTLETGMGDTYAPVVVNFTATSANNSILTFSPTTASFGRVLLNSTPSINATLNNSGTVAGNFTGVTSNNGISAPASGSAAPGANTVAIQLQNNANGSGTAGNNSWTYTITNTAATGDTSTVGKTLTVSADVVAPRAFNVASVSGTLGPAGGAISIPFSFTSTGDFATTTSVAVNAGGGSVSSNGFSTSGSYTFNGGQATIGNVTFNSATDTYTASGTITGTLNPGQSVAGSISLPITTLETGLGDTYAPVVVNFLASAAGPGGNNSVLAFSPTTVNFGRVLLHSGRGIDAALTNAGTDAGTYTAVASNNGISAPASGSFTAGPGGGVSIPIILQNNANGTGTVGNDSWTYTVTNTADTGDTIVAGKTLTVSADVVAERTFFSATATASTSPLSNSNPINANGIAPTSGGTVSIPFFFTSTGDLATTTSVTVHGSTSGGFSISGSFLFNGNDASSSNVAFDAATDTYTAEGFITGNLSAGQTATGTIQMEITTNETGLGDNYAPIYVHYTATAPTAATADTSNLSGVFGPVISKVILAGATYAGIGTTVTAGNGATSPVTHTTGGPIEHSTAIILAGTNTGANPVAVTMAWRTRTRGETPTSQGGTPISPPLPAGPVPLVSDVMQLTRTDAVIGSTPTSPYALEMNYDPSTLGSATAQGVEVSQNQLYLGWLDPNGSGPDVAGWDNAILGNTGDNAAAAEQGFLGSFAAFQAANGTNLASYIGAWGVDPTGDDAWAVLDHSSTFGVIGGPELMPVPEPSAALLAALGLAGLGCRRLKRRRGPECRSSRK